MSTNIGTPEQHHVNDLNPYHNNPRVGNVHAIAESLEINGVYKPIVVNRGTHTGRPMEILAGNHTWKAHKLLIEQGNPKDWETIDTWMVDVTDEQAARIVLADNRTADLGDYDNDNLLELLGSLNDGIEGTGYDDGYIDALLGMNTPDGGLPEAREEEAPDLTPPSVPISNSGDVWELGPHRLLIGDSTDLNEVKRMMGNDLADCIWTDPPYGVNYVGKTKDALTIKNDGADDLDALLSGAYSTCVEVSRPGAPVYIAHSDTERARFERHMRESGMIFRQNLIWVKNTLALGRSDYHYRHEPILYGFTPGGEGRLGRGGERWYGDNSQTTVFEVDKPSRNAEHPTMKPPELVGAMLKNSCPRNGIVLDVFAGSGSTMIAAQQIGAAARLVEFDPHYGDVICRRFESFTGEKPIRNGEATSFL